MRPQRTLLLGIIAGALCALAPETHAQLEPGPAERLGSAAEIPRSLSASDWTGIRAAYDASRHAAWAVAGGFRARNPGQQWTTRFDERGFSVEPDAGGWTWGLELQSYGVAGAERGVAAPARLRAEGQRVARAWDALLEEWYVNDGRGLEHGFIVRERPAGDDESPLAFILAPRGNLRAEVLPDGRGVLFVDTGGASAVTYTGLCVTDAARRNLPARLERAGADLRLLIEDRGARYPLCIDPIAQQGYLKASNTEADDRFGISVAVSGDTVVVGADQEDSAAMGVNGSQSSNGATDSGAAYVFVRSGATWTQQAYLKASNTGSTDHFGYAVAIAGDTVVVGARYEASAATGVNGNQADNSAFGSGAAYVFVRGGTTWSQQAYLKASNTQFFDEFGFSLSVSGDTLLVGARSESSNATGVNGNQNDNSAGICGAAYVFVRAGTTWSQQAYLKASNSGANDAFASSVALDGDTAVVGACFEDSSATGVNGNQSSNSAGDSGAAYVFVQSGAAWSQQAYLKASNTEFGDYFGWSVSVSGDTAVVGALHEDSGATGVNGNQGDNGAGSAGAAYVFTRSGATWSQQAYLKASNTEAADLFASSVAVSGDTVVIGAPLEASAATGVNGAQGDESANDAGAAYLFRRSGGIWSQQAYLKASNSAAADYFGYSVSVAGDTVVIGAIHEDSAATGVNGNENDEGALSSGAAYVFTAPCGPLLTYGTGCAGSGGFIPDLAMSGCATANGSLDLSIGQGRGGALAWLFVGATQTSLSMGAGCTLNVWPALGPYGPLPLSGSGPGHGSFSAPVALPPASPLGAVTVQAFVLDPGAALGFSNSNGVLATIE